MVPQHFPKIKRAEFLIPIIAYHGNKVKSILYKKQRRFFADACAKVHFYQVPVHKEKATAFTFLMGTER
jgi:hypothetical protein